MKHIRFLALLFLSGLLLQGISTSVSADSTFLKEPPYGTTPRYGGTLVAALSSDPRGLWPNFYTDSQSMYLYCQIFDGLIDIDYNGNLSPILAQSWEMSPDARQYTIHLVKNATWSDGVPFTSADVKWSVENVIYAFNPRVKQSLTSPEGKLPAIETPDAYTVVFRFADPYPIFLPFLSTGTNFYVVAKHQFDGVNATSASALSSHVAKTIPVSVGPFKFKEWAKGDRITVVRNENYWRKGEPYLDSIVFRIIPDDTAKLIAFSTGEIDLIFPENINLKEFMRIKNELPGFNASPHGLEGTGGINVLHMNGRNPILAKKDVRQAVAYAINKTEIGSSVGMGMVPVADNIVMASRTWAYNPQVTKYPYDPKKAEAMLDAAGYPKGKDGIRFKLVFKTYTGNSQWYDSSTIIASQLRKIGIDATLSARDYAVYLDDVFARFDYDLAITGFSDGPDPARLKNYMTAAMINKGSFTNCESYNNSRVDQLFTLYSKEPDYSKRVSAMFEIEKIISDDVPFIPLFERRNLAIVRDTFGGWFPSSGSGYYFSPLHNAWWEGAPLATTASTTAAATGTGVTVAPYEWIAAMAVFLVLAIGALAYTRRKKKQ